MKIVVIGCTELIGSKVVSKLREHGQEAIAASPKGKVWAHTLDEGNGVGQAKD